MEELKCCNCERMRAAQKAGPQLMSKSGVGGRRRGAGRKPSTIRGILKRLPPEAAELLIREIKAKAELIELEIKLDRLTKVDFPGNRGSRQNEGGFMDELMREVRAKAGPHPPHEHNGAEWKNCLECQQWFLKYRAVLREVFGTADMLATEDEAAAFWGEKRKEP